MCASPSIHPAHKQWYVVANLSKAAFLGVMVVSPSWWRWSYEVYGKGSRYGKTAYIGGVSSC